MVAVQCREKRNGEGVEVDLLGVRENGGDLKNRLSRKREAWTEEKGKEKRGTPK